MGASTGRFGTVRAQNHLHQVCLAVEMLPLPRPEVYVMRAASEFDENTEPVDETTSEWLGFLRR